MRRYLVVSCLAVLAVVLAPRALRADSFNFSISTISTTSASPNIITASGTFTTNPGVNGEYLVTSITGTLNVTSSTGTLLSSAPITLLGAGSWEGNDNLLNFQSGATELDSGGISFVANGVDYNLYYRVPLSSYVLNVGPGSSSVVGQTVSFTDPVNTPEPASFLLLSTGLAGLLFVFRRKLQLG